MRGCVKMGLSEHARPTGIWILWLWVNPAREMVDFVPCLCWWPSQDYRPCHGMTDYWYHSKSKGQTLRSAQSLTPNPQALPNYLVSKVSFCPDLQNLGDVTNRDDVNCWILLVGMDQKIAVWGDYPQIPSCCEQNLYQGFDPGLIIGTGRVEATLKELIVSEDFFAFHSSRLDDDHVHIVGMGWNGCFKHQRNTGLNVSGCSLMVIVYVLICFSLGWWSPQCSKTSAKFVVGAWYRKIWKLVKSLRDVR